MVTRKTRNTNQVNEMANAVARISLDGILNDASENSQNKSGKIAKVSESQKNYQPMEAGVRTTLWQEGFEYREFRRKNGFNHTKLEWIVPTDRT